MIDGNWIAAVLSETPGRIEAWRAQASQLKHLLATAEAGGTVSDELLESIEATSVSVRTEIERSSEVVRTVSATSPDAASQLVPLEDALRLVLLEITELSTQMYSFRSLLTREKISMIGGGPG